jgi:hypothetical protein
VTLYGLEEIPHYGCTQSKAESKHGVVIWDKGRPLV